MGQKGTKIHGGREVISLVRKVSNGWTTEHGAAAMSALGVLHSHNHFSVLACVLRSPRWYRPPGLCASSRPAAPTHSCRRTLLLNHCQRYTTRGVFKNTHDYFLEWLSGNRSARETAANCEYETSGTGRRGPVAVPRYRTIDIVLSGDIIVTERKLTGCICVLRRVLLKGAALCNVSPRPIAVNFHLRLGRLTAWMGKCEDQE